jgi:hypothetical protein
VRDDDPTSLLARHLPTSERGNRAGIDVAASPATAWDAVRRVRLADCPVSLALFTVRSVPARLLRRGAFAARDSVARTASTPVLEAMLRDRFVVLDERPGEEIVVGLVGRFWRLDGGVDATVRGAEDFAAFTAPGYVKAAANVRVVPRAGGSRVTTETRCVATDATARRRFAVYWAMIGWGSALIRRELLAAIRRRAEAAARS